jgi:hypothetical protein
MFGEVPVDAFTRAERLAREAGLLVAVGSSLQVWPVAGLPGETLRCRRCARDRQRGADEYDERAALVVRACRRSPRPGRARPRGRHFRRAREHGIMSRCRASR